MIYSLFRPSRNKIIMASDKWENLGDFFKAGDKIITGETLEEILITCGLKSQKEKPTKKPAKQTIKPTYKPRSDLLTACHWRL